MTQPQAQTRKTPAAPAARARADTALVRWVMTLTTAIAAMALAAMMLAQSAGASDATVSSSTKPLRIVALGDSLTAGYRLKPDESFPAQLQRALRKRGHNVEVLNAGVSGDTAGAGLQRFDWATPDDADALIVELGANDALRGIAPKQTRDALDALLKRASDRKLPTLVAGMQAPRNLGADYADAFNRIYGELAEKYGALHYPFFLEGVALDRKLNLDDGIHPTAEGIAVIVKNILPSVEQLIKRATEQHVAG